jgi:hypothetical protein
MRNLVGGGRGRGRHRRASDHSGRGHEGVRFLHAYVRSLHEHGHDDVRGEGQSH